MKLYLIRQNVNKGYDTYDSAVVCAADEDAAREITPDGDTSRYGGWCRPQHVAVEYIGEAAETTKQGVICASFNAG